MSDRQDPNVREQVIEPKPGHHDAPMPDKPIGTQQVRQGETSGRVRWVLGVSLLLVIILFILAYVVA
ncbi:hypothetical protein ACFOD4_14340 [Pseudoroseomonas globiformis]|uniref:Uncharacterized protein n=1 Tax=Teichococcus globiformis TaxID=2307229 RepID=A0ABV7G0P0_9PROT